MFKRFESYLLRDSNSPKAPLLLGLIGLIVYLTARHAGLFPMVFADEWLYNLYSRHIPAGASPMPLYPSYLFYALYGLTNYCGDAFLDCARQINVVFFALSLPLIYAVCRRFAPANLSVLVSLFAVFSPINSYSAYFMPESMYFFFFWLLTWFVVRGNETKPALMAAGAGIVLACMSMVKFHAVLLLPALLVALFSSWIFDRTANAFKHACRLAAILMATFFLVRLPLGYMLVGTPGLSITGSSYGSIASSMGGLRELIDLLTLARYNLWGHLLAVAVMFGVPSALILQLPLRKSVDYSEAESKSRFLKLYAAALLVSLMLMVALFAAKAVSMGPYESIGRLSLRYYNFTFPLLLMVAASTLVSTLKSSPAKDRMKWSFFAVAGLAAYALVSKFSGFSPYLTDAPELRAFTAYRPAFLVLGALGILCLILAAFRKRQGITLYLLIFVPLTIVTSTGVVSREFSQRLSPDVYDQAGQFANRYLGKDTANLVIFGPDSANLYRTHFYMSTPETLFFAVPNGQLLDTKLVPEGKEWLLLIGNYQHSYDPKEKIDIAVKNASGDVVGGYTLLRLTYATSLQITPRQDTQHSIGKFDPASNAMVSGKGEAGALIFGPYKQLMPGQYEATYIVTAESDADGAEVGILDVSGYIPPSIDDRLAQIPLKSARGEQIIKLRFEGKNPGYRYQFRVWLNGKGNRVSIRSINVQKVRGGPD